MFDPDVESGHPGKGLRKALRPLRRRRPSQLFGVPPGEPAEDSRARAYLFVLPNLFTSASLFLALFALVKSAEGMVLATTGASSKEAFVMACWCILLAAVCDAIDGPVARLTRTMSEFGLQYDSLADMVAFGLAPAFLMYARLRTMDPTQLPHYALKLALGACALFAICSAIRLARFNVQASTTEKKDFSGLPTPGAAGAVVTAYLFVEWFSSLAFVAEIEDPTDVNRVMHRSVLLLMTALALLMVSEIPFPKLRNLLALPRNPLHTLIGIVAIVCVMIAFQFYIPVLLFSIFVVYILGSLVRAYMGRRRERAASAFAASVE